MKTRRTIFTAFGIFSIGALLYLTGVFSYLENKTYDSRIKATGHFAKPSEDICFVAVDQDSIDWARANKGWGWPWPRKAYGDIVRYMTKGNASCVAFDVLFTEPSIYGTEDDKDFANACKENGHVIQTMFVSGDTGKETVLFPVEPINSSSALCGNSTSAKDTDDVIRRARLSFAWNGKKYPSLGFAPIELSAHSDTQIPASLPVRKDGTILLRYQKSLEAYHPYRASDILQSWDAIQNGTEPIIPPKNFENASVFFAFYAPGLFDICSSPVSQVYPGVGVHITLLDNIINNSFIKQAPLAISLLLILLASLAGAALVVFAERQKSSFKIGFITIAGAVFGILLITAISFALFIPGIWIPLVTPLFCFILSFGTELFLSYTTEGKQKRFIKSAFSQYLSPVVIDNLISDPHKLKLGGEQREISIYFSDVQGFTSISEGLTPTKLTEVLNTYLSEMSDIILKSGGTIDKYEGDALIAFWNAPSAEADHGRRALEAAMSCQSRLEQLRPMLKELSGGTMYQRIGLNTGYAVVGNMGSRTRFDYTMLGDSVNLASRLEGLNKQFGTYTMCTEATKNAAEKYGTQLCFRELARVAVVGKKEAVTVFEPLTKEIFESKQAALATFAKGRTLFYQGDFKEALTVFTANSVDDSPSKFYAAKCDFLLKNPPTEWDGVWKATEK